MDDIYNDTEDTNTDSEQDEKQRKDETYKNIIGHLFRAYFTFNFATVSVVAMLTLDILGGGTLPVLGKITNPLSELLPAAITYTANGTISGVINTAFFGGVILTLYGAYRIYKSSQAADDIEMDNLTITTNSDAEQERLLRQRGYINYGKKLTPIAITIGLAIGLLFAVVLNYAGGMI